MSNIVAIATTPTTEGLGNDRQELSELSKNYFLPQLRGLMTLPLLSEMSKNAIVRTSYGEEMTIINPTVGEVLRIGAGSVSYENPQTIVTHFRNDLNIWKPFN